MKLSTIPQRPHADGYIYAVAAEAGLPELVITTTVHELPEAEGTVPKYVRHRLDGAFRLCDQRLAAIPIQVLYDTPESNIVARYEGWSKTEGGSGGPRCIGDGEQAKFFDADTGSWQPQPCRGPGLCRIAKTDLACSPSVRMPVRIEGQPDQLAVYELRSSALNTYESILGTLAQLKAEFGTLRKLPLTLETWQKSTEGSNFAPFVCTRVGLQTGHSVDDLKANFKNEFDDLTREVDESREAFGREARKRWLSEVFPTEAEMQNANTAGWSEGTARASGRKTTTGRSAVQPVGLFNAIVAAAQAGDSTQAQAEAGVLAAPSAVAPKASSGDLK